MSGRRWPLAVAALVVAVTLVGAGWAAGRSSAPKKPTGSDQNTNGIPAAIWILDGVPIGVQRSRAGALAAADNYVATSSETVLQDAERYARFVRAVYTPSAIAGALKEGAAARSASPRAVENYAQGGRAVAVIGARKLEAYDGTHATALTWGGGFVWGPREKPSQRWFLVRTRLIWDGKQWRIASLQQLDRPAPAPASVVVTGPDADTAGAFDRELGGMEAPIYGVG